MKYLLVLLLLLSGCSKSPTSPIIENSKSGKFPQSKTREEDISVDSVLVIPIDSVVIIDKGSKFGPRKTCEIDFSVDSVLIIPVDSVVITPVDTGLVIQRPCSLCHEIQNGVILDEKKS